MSRMRVGLLFGGRSVEHDVSLISARSVMQNLNASRYEVVPVGITRDGVWLTAADAKPLLEPGGMDKALAAGNATRASICGDPTVKGLLPLKGGSPIPIDIAFPLIHGSGGEDGTLQGLLEMADLPYVGSGVAGSALGMDKGAMKRAFMAEKLAMTDHIEVTRTRIDAEPKEIAREVAGKLGYPCFTKPSNGGSSVGVSKVKSAEALMPALKAAAAYDRRVLIERAVDGQEAECAVLGNDAPKASVVGEIVPCNEFYDYNAKYLDDRSELIIPAKLTPKQADTVQKMSLAAFACLDLAGLARVDFLVRRADGAVLINEVNTLPGFTPISMYPRLWQAGGLAYPDLLDKLIELGLQRHQERKSLTTKFAPTERVAHA